MRTVFQWFFAVFAVLAVSCAKETGGGVSTFDTRFRTLYARWAEEPESRTEIQADGTTVMWTGEERINVFFGSEYMAEFVSSRYGKRRETEFTGLVPEGSLSGPSFPAEVWALYPYEEAAVCDGESICFSVPDEQAAKIGSFADNLFPAIARISGPDQPLSFYNVCGGACFSISEESIGSITFESIDGEALSGTVRVAFDAAGKPTVLQVIKGVDTVVITAPEGGFIPGKLYYATFLPGTHPQGLSIQIRKGRAVAERVTGRSITVNRSRFGRLGNLDQELEYWEDTSTPEPSDIILFSDARVKADCVAAFDTDGDGELSYQEAAAATSLAGVFHSKLGTSFDEFRYFTGIREIPKSCFSNWALMKRITLPEGLVSIGENAFWGCRSLKSLNIPTTLTDIGLRAFRNCVSLTEVSVGSLTQWLDLKFPSIDRADYEDTFPFYASGEGHLLIDGVEPTSVMIPDNCTEIREFAFTRCQSIKEVNLSSAIRKIGVNVFGGCNNLTRVHIPDIRYWIELDLSCSLFVTSHDGHIYVSGEEIKDIVIPESITKLGNYTFRYCTGLESIVMESVIPPTIGTYTFYGTTCPIYVWDVSLDLYLSDTNWQGYREQLRINPNSP